MPPTPGYIPGPLVIPNCVEVVLAWTLPDGKKATNVLHADNTAGNTVDDALCDIVFNGVLADARWTAYALRLVTVTKFDAVKMRDLDSALQPLVESTGASAPGTGGSDPLPDEVALVVSLKTTIAGRTGRGRTYLGGLSVSNVDASGHAIAGVQTDAAAFIQAVADALFATSMPLVVANRAHASYVSPSTGLTVPAEAAGFHRVTTIKVDDNLFDSQRRRK